MSFVSPSIRSSVLEPSTCSVMPWTLKCLKNIFLNRLTLQTFWTSFCFRIKHVFAVRREGLGAALVSVVAVIWKCVLSSERGSAPSEPRCRLLEELADRIARRRRPRSSPSSAARGLQSLRRTVQNNASREPTAAHFRHCDYVYWSAGIKSTLCLKKTGPLLPFAITPTVLIQ